MSATRLRSRLRRSSTIIVLGIACGAVHSSALPVAFAATSTLSSAATATEPAVRLDPPQAPMPPLTSSASPAPPTALVASSPPVPLVNTSTCRSDRGDPAMTITIPDISYVCPVYSGDQTTLDSGAVTLIHDDVMAPVLARHPGESGTLWIAGHRSSHRGVFAAVPDLADGAVVTVSDSFSTASYRIVGRVYVTVANNQVEGPDGRPTGAATADSILRPDRGGNGAARLVLQTCDGAEHRWMIYADLIVVTND